MRKIYLDNASTTRVYPSVVKEMQKFMVDEYGNPSSQHSLGEKARKAIDNAREKIAKEINAKPWEIIFTSGATEANNIALIGLAKASNKKKIVISAIEHPSITEPCRYLESIGYKIVRIPVDAQGHLRIDKLKEEVEKNSHEILVVSVMHVNNIIGTIQDIDKIGEICRKKNVLFHSDAAQSFGKLNMDISKMNVDLMSASGHKIGAGKGIGFLYIREGVKIEPIIYGGGQEKGIRSGTENVPGIIGMAKALEMQKKVNKDKILRLRDELIEELQKINGKINGSIQERIYNNVNVSFPLIDSGVLVEYLSKKGIYVSSGSACDSKKDKEDETLRAIGLTSLEAKGAVRITLNEDITENDIEIVINEIKKAVKKLGLN
jgi:cysteine desulfurase